MALPRGRAAAAIAGATILGTLFCIPQGAVAATTQTATNTLPLLPGSLSIGALTNTTLTSTSVTTGSLVGAAIDSGTWSDNTGSGAGWHGTISTSTFQYEGTWSQTAGTATALGGSPVGFSGSYTGAVADALLTVTVSAGGTVLNTPFTWTDREGASTPSGTQATCTNNTACAVSNGVTITFAAATSYPANAVYAVKVGTFPTTALTLAAGGTSTNNAGTSAGANIPVFENNASTVTAGGVGTQGSAVAFLTAPVNDGVGSFTIAPGVTITWDGTNTWAASFVATAQYTIVSGP
jgi:hypothetical protein